MYVMRCICIRCIHDGFIIIFLYKLKIHICTVMCSSVRVYQVKIIRPVVTCRENWALVKSLNRTISCATVYILRRNILLHKRWLGIIAETPCSSLTWIAPSGGGPSTPPPPGAFSVFCSPQTAAGATQTLGFRLMDHFSFLSRDATPTLLFLATLLVNSTQRTVGRGLTTCRNNCKLLKIRCVTRFRIFVKRTNYAKKYNLLSSVINES